MGLLHSVPALSQDAKRPQGPRPAAADFSGSALMAGLSANCSTRFWLPVPKVTVSSLGRWPGHSPLVAQTQQGLEQNSLDYMGSGSGLPAGQ